MSSVPPVSPTLHVRAARAADGVALFEIDRATWTETVSPGVFRPEAGTLFGPDTVLADYLVAESDGRVAGYARVSADIPIPSAAHVQQIQALAVDPAAQGRGVGRALLDAARDLAVQRGARKLTLRVLGTNAPARALYRSCGYVEEGVLKEHFLLGGHYVDDVLMALRLS